jgi:NADH:ubiquinone oxidoreductase subunit 2 (subunit N)
VAIALRYTMVRSVYYLKVIKICYVDNPTSWASYGKVSPLTAYIVRLSVFIMLIGLWHGNALFLFTHL